MPRQYFPPPGNRGTIAMAGPVRENCFSVLASTLRAQKAISSTTRRQSLRLAVGNIDSANALTFASDVNIRLNFQILCNNT